MGNPGNVLLVGIVKNIFISVNSIKLGPQAIGRVSHQWQLASAPAVKPAYPSYRKGSSVILLTFLNWRPQWNHYSCFGIRDVNFVNQLNNEKLFNNFKDDVSYSKPALETTQFWELWYVLLLVRTACTLRVNLWQWRVLPVVLCLTYIAHDISCINYSCSCIVQCVSIQDTLLYRSNALHIQS